jgi:hypothetical protein
VLNLGEWHQALAAVGTAADGACLHPAVDSTERHAHGGGRLCNRAPGVFRGWGYNRE